jgi:hypothetical protein
MGFRSSLPVVLMSAVGLVTVGLSASSGANKAIADPSSGDRLGCGTFCQIAGGYGAPGGQEDHSHDAVTLVSTGTVTADVDGYVPVTLKCHLSVQCVGALMLFSEDGGEAAGGGRSDLLVNAGATRTIGVPAGADAVAYLRSHGPTTYNLTIDARQAREEIPTDGFGHLSLENDVTVAAPG